MKTGLVAVLTIILSGQLAAQWLEHPTAGIPRTPDGKPNLKAPPPRLPDGRPDLSGLWAKDIPKYSRNIAADLKPDEIQPWAREVVEQRKEDLGKDGMQVRCLPLGPAYPTSGDSTGSEMMRVVQSPQHHRDAQSRSHVSPDLDGRPRARGRTESVMDGILRGPLGGRYARRREQRLPRRNLARSGRPSPHGAAASD